MKNTSLHFLIMASSLFVMATIMGLSAYLTDSGSYSQTFTLASGSEFGIKLEGEEPTKRNISPNEIVELNPTVSNTGTMDTYLFAVVDVPEEFTIINGIDPSWSDIGMADDGVVYCYGSGEELAPFGENASSIILGSVQFTDLDELPVSSTDYTITVKVYAIQTVGFDADNPSRVWGDIRSDEG